MVVRHYSEQDYDYIVWTGLKIKSFDIFFIYFFNVPGSSKDEEVLFLKAAIYSLLLQIHTDKADWRGALKLLDQATKDLSGTTYHP